MKYIIIASIIALLLIAGAILAVSSTVNANTESASDSGKCFGCIKNCTKESGCGLQSCGASKGKACTCGK